MRKVNDLHIRDIQPLIPPAELKQRYPLPVESAELVYESRETIKKIVNREDPRIIGIVGPCSIHDTKAAFEYAKKLNALRDKVKDKIYIIMRVYFEKPRTTIGWRGLIVDPQMDGSYDIAAGLETARKTLIEITSLGLPAGSEMLDPYVPQYIDDLVSWAAIGARTTESQTHRDMASGLSMPVGFKNGTDGRIESAVNALAASLAPHSFIGIDQKGRTCILNTSGNPHSHLILRGGRDGPNYHTADIDRAAGLLEEVGAYPSIL